MVQPRNSRRMQQIKSAARVKVVRGFKYNMKLSTAIRETRVQTTEIRLAKLSDSVTPGN